MNVKSPKLKKQKKSKKSKENLNEHETSLLDIKPHKPLITLQYYYQFTQLKREKYISAIILSSTLI